MLSNIVETGIVGSEIYNTFTNFKYSGCIIGYIIPTKQQMNDECTNSDSGGIYQTKGFLAGGMKVPCTDKTR